MDASHAETFTLKIMTTDLEQRRGCQAFGKLDITDAKAAMSVAIPLGAGGATVPNVVLPSPEIAKVCPQ